MSRTARSRALPGGVPPTAAALVLGGTAGMFGSAGMAGIAGRCGITSGAPDGLMAFDARSGAKPLIEMGMLVIGAGAADTSGTIEISSCGGSIDMRTSTACSSLRSSAVSSASGGLMLSIGARWWSALASAPRSSGRCCGSLTRALDRRISTRVGQLRVHLARATHRRTDGVRGEHLVENGADGERRSPWTGPARGCPAAPARRRPGHAPGPAPATSAEGSPPCRRDPRADRRGMDVQLLAALVTPASDRWHSGTMIAMASSRRRN